MHIGDAKVTVLEVRGDTVKLGIDASRNVPVLRTELKTVSREERDEEVLRNLSACG